MPSAADTPGVHERCGQALHARGIAAVNAAFAVGFLPVKYEQYLSRIPDPNSMGMPCGVFFINEGEQVKDFSTHRELIGFPVHWGVLDRNIDSKDRIPRELLKLREVTADSIRDQVLDVSIVPESSLVQWVPEKVIGEEFADIPAWKHLFSTMTFICWCKRVRGLKS